MDIRDIHSRGTNPADESRNARSVGSSSSARNTERASDDRVTLSNRAQAFQEARRAALDVPDVRTDRVEAVRQQVKNGSLVPDPERIAQALLGQGIVGS